MNKALEATRRVDEYTEAVDRHRQEVAASPSELIRLSILSMEKAKEVHSARRVELEADHRTRLEEFDRFYTAHKDVLNISIVKLEEDLRALREQWTKMCEDERDERAAEKARWLADDASQRKLIAAEEMMIAQLRS
jgi:hypothetical protein